MANIYEAKNKEYFLKKFPREIDELDTSKDNREAIKTFLNLLQISYTRKLKYLFTLKYLARWTDFEFKDASREDISRLVGKIEEQGYKPETARNYRLTLKYFYKLVYGEGEEVLKVIFEQVYQMIILYLWRTC